ncbi:MAG: PorT family protein [Bacteroidetes bacterium]|nr:PorT family protein [Bacteroidota bacterium]
MKKTLLITALLIAVFSFNNLNAQVKGGFKLGADFSRLNMDYDDDFNDETKRLISPRLGFIIEVPVNDFLFVQAGVFGAAKGWRVSEEDAGDTYKAMMILGTIDIPIQFGYKYDLGNIKLFGMAGPVISYNVYSTLVYKWGDEDWDNDNSYKIGNSEADFFKPLNMGVNIEAGVELNRFQFSAFYMQGLSNLNTQDGDKYTTNVIGLTAAIKFGRVD